MRTVHESAVVSPHARIYASRLVVGKHSRIDDGAILTGDIEIGDYVHIAAYAVLTGKAGIKVGSYTGISMYCGVFTGTDDFSGASMVGPTVPEKYKPGLNVGRVEIGRNVMIGAHCTILPGVKIGDGAAVGAHSLVKEDLAPDAIYAGVPAKRLKHRRQEMWDLMRQLESV